MDVMDASSFSTATGASGLSPGCGDGSGRPLLSSSSDGCGAGRHRAELATARVEAVGRGRPLLRPGRSQKSTIGGAES
jgi:hypothetical protein